MSKIWLAVIGLALTGQVALAQDADRIGTTAAATNEVQGRRDGAGPRGLKVGDAVYRNEEIKTGRASKAQLLFRDETVFSLGPNSVAVLDKFVYDPDKKTGEVAIKAVTGAFRFVSGSGPKENYRINTPAGSIGVRGTSLTFSITGSQLIMKLDSGAAELCSGSNCVKVTQPGTYVVSSGGNTTPPMKVGDAACGGGTCRQEFSDSSPLVITFISDIVSQETPPQRGDIQPPGHAPRGHGFFGPRP